MKKIKILLITLILILGGVIFSNTYAEEATKIRTLSDRLDRPFNDPDFENPIYEYTVKEGLYKVVKIYDNEDKDEKGNLVYSKVFYCLRGGLGFGSTDETEKAVQYTEIGEMHENVKTILEQYYKDVNGKAQAGAVSQNRINTISQDYLLDTNLIFLK